MTLARASLLMLMVATACKSSPRSESTDEGPPPWATGRAEEPERPGMVWIPAGTLVAGTPPGRLPRIADEELPGDAIELKGFFVDRFNHPGEPGAIPETGLSYAEARAVCEKQGKRLCTELEWERVCKGPDNLTYEYGDAFDPAICGMDATDSMAPNGLNTRCESRWGVRDLHGSAATWTASPWGRGSDGSQMVVRGGVGRDGALAGRCAYGRPVAPGERDASIGVRCCAGEANTAEVVLETSHKADIFWRTPSDADARQLEALLPAKVRVGRSGEPVRIVRSWVWRPNGNEELVVGGGCAESPRLNECGVVVVRTEQKGPEFLAWVSTDEWMATISRHASPRGIFIYGGDRQGAFRKRLMYEFGSIDEGPKERKKKGIWVRPFPLK